MNRRFEGRRRSSAFGARGSAFLFACVAVVLALGVVVPSAGGPAPTFARAANYATGSGPFSIGLSDLNGDDKPDLATANGLASSVSVLLNGGDGSFEAKRHYRTGRYPSLALGD